MFYLSCFLIRLENAKRTWKIERRSKIIKRTVSENNMDKNKKRASGKCDQTQKPAKSILDLCSKYIKKNQNTKESRMLSLLLGGGQYSALELGNAIHTSDPRSIIRTLRNDMIPINDFWFQTDSSRYKIYFLAGCGSNKTQNNQ